MAFIQRLARHSRGRPGLRIAVVAILAAGIGAPTAVFSVLHAVLVRPLPFPDPDRLVQFRVEGHDQQGPVVFDALPVNVALDWSRAGTTLAALALYNDRGAIVLTPDGPARLMGIEATPNLFDVVGVRPAIGRVFAGASRDTRQVVLSDETWERHFARDPAIVGRTITVDGVPHAVTGVMPRAFGFPTPEAAFWVPVLLDQGNGGRGMLLSAVARLSSGATPADAAADGRRRLDEAGDLPNSALTVQTMQDQMVGGVRRLLWVLVAAAGFVFVIAVSNVALLLLARGAGRTREMATRLALGATRADLVRQLAGEALMLAVPGGLAGLGVTYLFIDVLVRLAPPEMPRLHDVSLDGHVLACAAVLTVAASLVFGVLAGGPAVLTDAFAGLGRRAADNLLAPARSSSRRMRRLAAAGLALTMVLLVGAGLLLRSFAERLLVDQGFDARGALALQINLPAVRYPTPADRRTFHEGFLERVRALPDLDAAGVTSAMPNRQPSGRFGFGATGFPLFPDPMTIPVAEVRTVSEGFFEAMGMRLRAGRGFTAADTRGAENVVVISERLARQHYPDRNPIGARLYLAGGSRRIVGVVGDVRPAAPGRDVAPAFYLPMRQDDGVFRWFGTVTVIVRGRHVDRAAQSIRSLLLSIDAEMPPFNVRPLDDDIAALTAVPRFAAFVVAAFGVLALGLAAMGVFSVTSYLTSLRTREIGLRIALGATRAGIRRLVLGDGIRLVAAGLSAGLFAAVWLARALTGLLDDVAPADPISLASVALLLATVGLIAVWLPARRATRVSALSALRDD